MKINERKIIQYMGDILEFLFEEEKFFIRTKKITKEGFFPCSIKNIQKATSLSRYKQDRIFAILKNKKVIQTRISGQPGRRFFKIDHNIIDSEE